ncbi:MAG: hypothetical protein AMXMBFR33_51730 [Candidatus Xenobia bacterium]|jgi:hypothetical protein
MNRNSLLALSCAFLVALVALAARADDDDKKLKGKHPLAVLKGVINSDNGTTLGAMRGDATIWLKNVSDVAVDGVKVEMVIYNGNNGRKLETLTKDIGELNAGDKKYLNFKWEIYGATTIKPKVWVYYNGGGEEPVKFDGEPPVWNGQ